jgi:hypothetical protein
MKIKLGDFAEAISTRIWDSVGRANWRNFKDARALVQSLDLSSGDDWRKYCQFQNRPADIPTHPHIIYRKAGWVSWGDWLGTRRIADHLREFRPFKEARAFACSLSLRSETEWREYAKSGKKPHDIPASPSNAYAGAGWTSWGDWLGTGRRRVTNIRPFRKAREFVRGLGLKSKAEWREYTKSGRCPRDIPNTPYGMYASWVSWDDWLGTTARLLEYRSFTKARAFVRRLGLQSGNQWRAYSKSGKRPQDIPPSPDKTYLNKGWAGWGDWLGTGKRPPGVGFRPFAEARAFARGLGLMSRSEWLEYAASSRKPADIPAYPKAAYAKAGWSSWFDWLGAGRHRGAGWQPFTKARSFVHGLGLKSHAEWIEYCASRGKPQDIPSSPPSVYAKSGWKNWGDWLGTDTIAPSLFQYRSFKEARAFARRLGLKSWSAWGEYCRSGRKPDDIPAKPYRTYSNSGWVGMGDWLGSGRRLRSAEWIPFKRARSFVRRLGLRSHSEWIHYCKSSKKPADLPTGPNVIYADRGWAGWGDWLGTGSIAPSLRQFRSFKKARARVCARPGFEIGR